MNYFLDFTQQATEDIQWHRKSGNKTLLKKIAILLEELCDHPYTGTGKPEPLKHSLASCWSRRINREHRLVYEVTSNAVLILSLKGHYK